MNSCIQCNREVINYSNQICRRQFLPPLQHQKNKYNRSRSIQKILRNVNNLKYIINKFKKANKFKSELTVSGNSVLDEFIKETQLNSECCDDFIEWIPHENLESIIFLTNGGNSK